MASQLGHLGSVIHRWWRTKTGDNMRWLLQYLVVMLAVAGLPAPSVAQDQFTVASCPKFAKLPISFSIDCSHVSDPEQKKLCRPFIENVACKVFPAYREITELKLETHCASIKYTIYDKNTFPHHGGEGGLSLRCAVDYVADYSIGYRSKLGPYDVHEILHQYQAMLGALPDAHVLFGSSMAEAIRLIGDDDTYDLTECSSSSLAAVHRCGSFLSITAVRHFDQCR
jgi:hypothetical protein